MPKTLELGPSLCGRIRELTDELTEEETALYLFFKLSPDMFCIADTEGMLRKVNAAWTNTLGWAEQELVEQPFLAFIHPDDVDRTKHIMGHMAEQDVIRFHNRYRKKDSNDYVVVEWSATAWINGLTYAVGRQVPDKCLTCPDSEERLGWKHRDGGSVNGPKP
jgi:PAS domain S-box-containing protein